MERYRDPASEIDVPVLLNGVLVFHLTGPVLIEQESGAGKLERRWAGSGQMSVLPAGQSVRSTVKGRADVVLLHLSPEFVQEVAGEVYGHNDKTVALVRRFAVHDRTVDPMVRLLLAEAETPGPNSRLMMELLGRALVIHLLRFHSTVATERPQITPGPPPQRIQRVIEQMRSRLDESLALPQLAAIAGLSQSQLARAFRDAVGMPPHRYLTSLRIEKAKKLLETTDLPVSDVALGCGFGQPTSFATAFREATGFSPRAWRRALRS